MSPRTLKSLRKRARLTQGQLAECLDIHRLTVSSWERGVWPIKGRSERAIKALFSARLLTGGIRKRLARRPAPPRPARHRAQRRRAA
jgi:transcriptional regulator with XRE-family HTH domain